MEETANANANLKSAQNNCEMCHFSGEVLVPVSKAPSVKYKLGILYIKRKVGRYKDKELF